jgi:hypothetical protein
MLVPDSSSDILMNVSTSDNDDPLLTYFNVISFLILKLVSFYIVMF